jgi:hypothetical protein
MRFIISSYQGVTLAPDGSRTNGMQVLDMVEAPTAEDAIEMFREDNPWIVGSGFKEMFCVELSGRPFISFVLDPPSS